MNACSNHTVHAILHLSIATLYCVEVERGICGTLYTRASGAAPHTDAIRRPAHLAYNMTYLRIALYCVPTIHAADTSREHDWLDELIPLSRGQPLAEGACKACYDWLTVLVAVVRSAV